MPRQLKSGALSESTIQKEFVRWVREEKGDYLFTCTIGGMRCKPWEKQRLIHEGYNSGVPDLLFFTTNDKYNGLAIEMKSLSGKCSEQQLSWLSKLEDNGWACVVCNNILRAKMIYTDYMEGRDVVSNMHVYGR